VTDEALTSRTGTERITTRVPESLLEAFDEATDNRSETIRELMRMYVGRENDISTGRTEVSPERCDEWREMVRDGANPLIIASGTPWSRSTIEDHAKGRCSHKSDEGSPSDPPVADGGARDEGGGASE